MECQYITYGIVPMERRDCQIIVLIDRLKDLPPEIWNKIAQIDELKGQRRIV